MSGESQISNIERTVNEIIAKCRNDPARTEIAKVNFIMLIETMKKYEKGPKYYNAIMEESDIGFGQVQSTYPMPQDKRGSTESYQSPVLAELEKIYSKKLKQKDLQKLGSELSRLAGLRLDRNTKRSKQELVNWFQTNWSFLHSKIYEHSLQNLDFENPNQKIPNRNLP